MALRDIFRSWRPSNTPRTLVSPSLDRRCGREGRSGLELPDNITTSEWVVGKFWVVEFVIALGVEDGLPLEPLDFPGNPLQRAFERGHLLASLSS